MPSVYSKFDSPEEEISTSFMFTIDVSGGEREYLLDEDGTFDFIHVP